MMPTMTSYTKKALSVVFIIGISLYGVSCLIPTWHKFGILSCTTGLFSFAILLAGHFNSKQGPKARKKKKRGPETSGFHHEQALDIMYGLDDGHRHYEKLPPEQRRKSIFGGKNGL